MNRISQPSTWAGIAAMLQMLSAFLPPQYALIAHTLTAVTGAAAVALQEQGPLPAPVVTN